MYQLLRQIGSRFSVHPKVGQCQNRFLSKEICRGNHGDITCAYDNIICCHSEDKAQLCPTNHEEGKQVGIGAGAGGRGGKPLPPIKDVSIISGKIQSFQVFPTIQFSNSTLLICRK